MTRFLPLVVAVALAAGVTPAPAYYHYVHFADGPGGKVRTVEKFDLEALPDKRVLFYVSRQELPALAVNDSFDGVLSQVRQALSVWNAVPTSELRVGFGGVVDGVLPGNAPAGQIIFAELPPGVIGMGGPVITGDAGGDFVPIVRSQVVLSNNLVDGSRPRTSFSGAFFSTLVHEIGHALGLQHTLASSAMSTDVTRATTRSQPLGADDLAGLSALYPTPSFTRRTGEIAGRVVYRSGEPAPLASVTAIHPAGLVVTALTDPDGGYRIEGLLPGDYLLCVQPLPPATQGGLGPANLVLPVDAEGSALGAGSAFRGVFLGGTDRPESSQRIAVRAGRAIAGVDFQVESRPSPSLYNVTTYSFPGNNAPAVHPAFLDLTARDGFLVATGQGLIDALPKLEIAALGREVPIRAMGLYQPDGRFAQIDFSQAPFVSLGPLHLLFRTPDDLYLLPGAVQVTNGPAPVIHWITPDLASAENAWRVGGEQFDPAAEVYFDGAPGRIVEFDAQTQEIVVIPPQGPPGRRAVVTVYNPDGQSSALTLPDGNAVFAYEPGPEPTFEMAPAEAAPDTDVVVTVHIVNAQLEPSELTLGAGASDIVVRDLDPIGPDRFRAVVTVLKGAQPGRYPVTLSNGLQTLVRPNAFEVIAAPSQLETKPRVRYHALVNSATGLPDLSPGVLASLFGVNLTGGDSSSVKVRINGVEARLLAVTNSQINLQIPEQIQPGAAELVVVNASGQSDPMLIRLERASPGLFAALSLAGSGLSSLDPGRSASLLATGLGSLASNAKVAETAPPVQVVLGGMRLRPTRIEPAMEGPGAWRVDFDVPDLDLPDTVRVVLLVDGLVSNAPTLSTVASVAAVGGE